MMKKKNKYNRKKALTAVGAVVAAGLTPGFIAATPGCMPVQGPNVEVTAADAVAIDGQAYNFDELYAMQQVRKSQVQRPAPRPQQQATRYGVPRPQQQAAKYGAPPPPRPQYPPSTLYGVPRPHVPAVVVEQKATVDREEIQTDILEYLMNYCSLLIDADKRGIVITPDSDLTKNLGLTEDELKELKAEIEESYGVEVSHHRFRLKGQLNTLRLVSEYITKLKTIWD